VSSSVELDTAEACIGFLARTMGEQNTFLHLDARWALGLFFFFGEKTGEVMVAVNYPHWGNDDCTRGGDRTIQFLAAQVSLSTVVSRKSIHAHILFLALHTMQVWPPPPPAGMINC